MRRSTPATLGRNAGGARGGFLTRRATSSTVSHARNVLQWLSKPQSQRFARPPVGRPLNTHMTSMYPTIRSSALAALNDQGESWLPWCFLLPPLHCLPNLDSLSFLLPPIPTPPNFYSPAILILRISYFLRLTPYHPCNSQIVAIIVYLSFEKIVVKALNIQFIFHTSNFIDIGLFHLHLARSASRALDVRTRLQYAVATTSFSSIP